MNVNTVREQLINYMNQQYYQQNITVAMSYFIDKRCIHFVLKRVHDMSSVEELKFLSLDDIVSQIINKISSLEDSTGVEITADLLKIDLIDIADKIMALIKQSANQSIFYQKVWKSNPKAGLELPKYGSTEKIGVEKERILKNQFQSNKNDEYKTYCKRRVQNDRSLK